MLSHANEQPTHYTEMTVQIIPHTEKTPTFGSGYRPQNNTKKLNAKMSNVQNTTNEPHVIDCIICIFLSLRKKGAMKQTKKQSKAR